MSDTHFDVIVLGAGPGGYLAAERLGHAGKKVALVEEQYLGGTCLNVGCIPTKTLLNGAKNYLHAKEASQFGVDAQGVAVNWTQMQAWKDQVVKGLVAGVAATERKAGVTVINGRGHLDAPGRVTVEGTTYTSDHVIIATGSVPAMPPLPGTQDNPALVDSTGILSLPEVPSRLAIIGGGVIGVEFASLYATLGSQVTVIEMAPEILPFMDDALAAKAREAEASSDAAIFAGAQKARNALIEKLNNANYHMVADKGVDIYDGTGEFVGPKTVRVNGEQGTWLLTADTIIINTGARPVVPPIPGVDSKRVVDSTGIQFLPTLPGRLAVVGGGPIGLEYADMFAQLGVEVTVIDAAPVPFTRFDADVASVATDILAKHGVQFVNGAKVASFVESGDGVVVNYSLTTPAVEAENQELAVDYVLLAIGRRPATDGLGLETAGIATGARGEVVVDEFCRTNVPGVFAVGDVNGGPQFTYISFDDHLW
mgnify:CR=1 FL=1